MNLPIPTLTWCVLASGCAVAVGIGSASVQLLGIAPLGLSPLASGAILGLFLLGSVHFCGLQRPQQLVAVTVAMAVVAVASQHVWMYRDYCRHWHHVRAETPELAFFRAERTPPSFTKYMTAQSTPRSVLHWGIDGALLAIAAVFIVRWGRAVAAVDGQLEDH